MALATFQAVTAVLVIIIIILLVILTIVVLYVVLKMKKSHPSMFYTNNLIAIAEACAITWLGTIMLA